LTLKAKNLNLDRVKKTPVSSQKVLKPKILIPIIVIVAIIAIIGIVAGIYFFNQYQKAQKLLTNPKQASVQEVQGLVNKIGLLIELPSGEVPRVATVSDAAKLKTQSFFKNAQNGDRVLIYSQNKKAIIYRPSTNKIIEVGNLNIEADAASNTNQNPSSSTSATVSPGVEKKVTVALYNGTTTVGLTKTVEAQITSVNSNVEVIARENAVKSDYPKTIVIDLSGNNSALVQKLATQYKGEVGPLPAGEVRPDQAEILVILGAAK
jgi:hypothetical protein